MIDETLFENLNDFEVVEGEPVLLYNPMVLDKMVPKCGNRGYRIIIGNFGGYPYYASHGSREAFTLNKGAILYKEPVRTEEGTKSIVTKLNPDKPISHFARAERIFAGKDAILFAIEDESEIKRIIGEDKSFKDFL